MRLFSRLGPVFAFTALAPLASITALGAATAFAAPSASDKATAQTLFDEARKLLAKKEYAEACKKLEESQKLDPAMGTKFRLGECYELVGRTASAWAIFREVADDAKATGQAKREQAARERANKLEPKLAKLTVKLSGPATVKRDDTPLGEGQLGVALPVDPGPHRVEASGKGKKPWETTVDVAPEKFVTVTVPVLEDEKVEPKPAPPPEPRETWQKPAGLVTAGLGVASLAVSTVFILSARSSVKDSESHCVGNACDPTGLDLRDRAVTKGNVSTVFFVVGVAALAGGAVLYLTAPSSDAPAVGVGPGFLTVEGRF